MRQKRESLELGLRGQLLAKPTCRVWLLAGECSLSLEERDTADGKCDDSQQCCPNLDGESCRRVQHGQYAADLPP
jgi:hypothetical protein